MKRTNTLWDSVERALQRLRHTEMRTFFVWTEPIGRTSGSQATHAPKCARLGTTNQLEAERNVRVRDHTGGGDATRYETNDGANVGTQSIGSRYQLRAAKGASFVADASLTAAQRDVATPLALPLRVPRVVRRRDGTVLGVLRALRGGAPKVAKAAEMHRHRYCVKLP